MFIVRLSTRLLNASPNVNCNRKNRIPSASLEIASQSWIEWERERRREKNCAHNWWKITRQETKRKRMNKSSSCIQIPFWKSFTSVADVVQYLTSASPKKREKQQRQQQQHHAKNVIILWAKEREKWTRNSQRKTLGPPPQWNHSMNSNKSLFIRSEETHMKKPSNDFWWCIHISRGGGVGRGSANWEKSFFSGIALFDRILLTAEHLIFATLFHKLGRAFVHDRETYKIANAWVDDGYLPTTTAATTTTAADILLGFLFLLSAHFVSNVQLCGALAVPFFLRILAVLLHDELLVILVISISLDADSQFIDVTRSAFLFGWAEHSANWFHRSPKRTFLSSNSFLAVFSSILRTPAGR